MKRKKETRPNKNLCYRLKTSFNNIERSMNKMPF